MPTQSGAGYIKRADTEELRKIFLQFATAEKNGEKCITSEDFVRKFLGLYDAGDYNKDSVQLIASIVDLNNDGFITFKEFQTFEGLLCVPDALYKTVFQLFDTKNKAHVSFNDFAEVIQKTARQKRMPFNMESAFIGLYFGKDKGRPLTYPEFSQFLHDFHEEYGLEAFRRSDRDGTGFISARDFKDIMLTLKNHLLTKELRDKVIEVSGFPQGKDSISFPYYMAFNSLLNNMELIKRVYLNATQNKRNVEVTKEEFLHSAQMMSQVTPLEVDILFTLCDTINRRQGRILYKDLSIITPEQYFKHVNQRIADIKAVSSPDQRSVLIQVMETVYRFLLGSIAGATGAATVYPIDLVKTRMQNQRIGPNGERVYKNSLDCAQKVIKNEGVRGLYRGLIPQLVGVCPEKAVKLAANDFARDKFMDKNGKLAFWQEAVSGGFGGCCQVIFTNPLEIVKIRLQVAGETKQKLSAFTVIKELGLFGLYKGARACVMRDVAFTAIYFPTYGRFKALFADDTGYNHPLTLLAAGALAGMPAASLVTPADFVKTRLQVIPKKGQTTYNGIFDAYRKIYAEEGFRAFWKGTAARVCRSSPQFGVTLVTYELLQRLLYVDFGGSKPTGSVLKVATSVADDSMRKVHHIGGYRVALPILTGMETKFGISLPRFSAGNPQPPSS